MQTKSINQKSTTQQLIQSTTHYLVIHKKKQFVGTWVRNVTYHSRKKTLRTNGWGLAPGAGKQRVAVTRARPLPLGHALYAAAGAAAFAFWAARWSPGFNFWWATAGRAWIENRILSDLKTGIYRPKMGFRLNGRKMVKPFLILHPFHIPFSSVFIFIPQIRKRSVQNQNGSQGRHFLVPFSGLLSAAPSFIFLLPISFLLPLYISVSFLLNLNYLGPIIKQPSTFFWIIGSTILYTFLNFFKTRSTFFL
jgi:hypothetical protein